MKKKSLRKISLFKQNLSEFITGKPSTRSRDAQPPQKHQGPDRIKQEDELNL